MDISNKFVHFAILRLRPEWRVLDSSRKNADADLLVEGLKGTERVAVNCYTLIGTEPGADLMLWLTGETADECQELIANILKAGMGRYFEVVGALISITDSSEYIKAHNSQTQSLGSVERGRYLIVYPFAKTPDWYLLSHEERGGMMKEHARIGSQYKSVRQVLGYSFGFDDHEFVVAYETDSLKDYKDLVRALRGIKVRRYTAKETPVFMGVHREARDAIGMFV
ncbi:MAG: chlorite dismutase family protein [Candidatus Micrarchaeota archaeon]|nr:chlorite dismutase family protein [Candidatus Micrarchaeota archaeon]